MDKHSLRMLHEWGADEVIFSHPVDYRGRGEPPSRGLSSRDPPQKELSQRELSKKPTHPSKASSPSDHSTHPAHHCQTIAALEKAVRDFDGCPLKNTALNTVFGDGNPEAPLLIIGEGPGAQEDKQGKPFVGASGQLLDQMLFHIGIKNRDSYFISNILYWRPPGNRSPTDQEIAACRPFFEKMIMLMNPKILLILGGSATTVLLQRPMGITKMRGKWYAWGEKATPTLVSFHPSFLLRRPENKAQAWRDMLILRQKLEEVGG